MAATAALLIGTLVVSPSAVVAKAKEGATPGSAYTETTADGRVRFDMVPIAGGTFRMGSPPGEAGRAENEGPQFQVEIDPFWMGKYEITWDEFNEFRREYERIDASRRLDDYLDRPHWAFYPWLRKIAWDRLVDLQRRHGLKRHIFRLAGIYGPGRNALAALRTDTARRIVKPGQVFSRIHLRDILGILQASMAKPHGGAVYNVCDDEAAPPQDVVTFASQLLALPPPPEIAIDDAGVSAMARSFYDDNKLVSNDRIKKELGVVLRYPDYRRGLQALLDAGEGRDG